MMFRVQCDTTWLSGYPSSSEHLKAHCSTMAVEGMNPVETIIVQHHEWESKVGKQKARLMVTKLREHYFSYSQTWTRVLPCWQKLFSSKLGQNIFSLYGLIFLPFGLNKIVSFSLYEWAQLNGLNWTSEASWQLYKVVCDCQESRSVTS